MPGMEMTAHNTTELIPVVSAILERAVALPNNRAVVVALNGDLGAGKTTLTQQLAARLGIVEQLTSPTFVVMKRYDVLEPGPAGQMATPFAQLVHVDAYRLDSVDELKVLRFDEILAEAGTIICIEWAERVGDILPAEHVSVAIDIVDGDTRTFTIT